MNLTSCYRQCICEFSNSRRSLTQNDRDACSQCVWPIGRALKNSKNWNYIKLAIPKQLTCPQISQTNDVSFCGTLTSLSLRERRHNVEFLRGPGAPPVALGDWPLAENIRTKDRGRCCSGVAGPPCKFGTWRRLDSCWTGNIVLRKASSATACCFIHSSTCLWRSRFN